MIAAAVDVDATFQSTLSVRRATYTLAAYAGEIEISIHALREESDRRRRATRPTAHYFNPRSP